MPATRPRKPTTGELNPEDARPGEATTQNLAYWMGKVDAVLRELRSDIANMFDQDDVRWKELQLWQKTAEARLAKGDNTFEELRRRLNEVEETICPLGDNCPVLKEVETHKKDEQPEEKAGFGSWAWFRDGYLDKAVTVLATLALYKIVEIIVANWKP